MELAELLARCREGNPLAWESLVRQYQARVYSVLCHYTGDREEARNLAQEVFVKIYRNLRDITDPGHFFPWVLRISRNVAVDHLRRTHARPPRQDVPVEELRFQADAGANPEEECHRRSRQELIGRALRQMTAINREMLILKEIQGLALEEVARLLRIPLGTAKSRSNRARLELAERVLALAGSGEEKSS